MYTHSYRVSLWNYQKKKKKCLPRNRLKEPKIVNSQCANRGPRIFGTGPGTRSAHDQWCNTPRWFADKPKTGVSAGGRILETGPVGFVETRGKCDEDLGRRRNYTCPRRMTTKCPHSGRRVRATRGLYYVATTTTIGFSLSKFMRFLVNIINKIYSYPVKLVVKHAEMKQ